MVRAERAPSRVGVVGCAPIKVPESAGARALRVPRTGGLPVPVGWVAAVGGGSLSRHSEDLQPSAARQMSNKPRFDDWWLPIQRAADGGCAEKSYVPNGASYTASVRVLHKLLMSGAVHRAQVLKISDSYYDNQ